MIKRKASEGKKKKLKIHAVLLIKVCNIWFETLFPLEWISLGFFEEDVVHNSVPKMHIHKSKYKIY